jgi:hypothetical protein
VRDGIELAKRGVPSIVILPEGLVPAAVDKARVYGLPDLPLAILDRSLYGMTLEEIAAAGRELNSEILAALVKVES